MGRENRNILRLVSPPPHFRHERKYEINASDSIIIRQRMRAVARPDPNAVNGKYQVRSLYFDNLYDTILRQKIDGVNCREKFRIRFYNGNTSFINLEKKCRINSLCSKENTLLTAHEVQWITEGNLEWMAERSEPLIQEFRSKMNAQGLRPKTIVDYTRIPFIYEPGNVRVTLDYDIRTSLSVSNFLHPESAAIPAGDISIILEIKWDSYLPDLIRQAVGLENRRAAAFSKYAQCRIYG